MLCLLVMNRGRGGSSVTDILSVRVTVTNCFELGLFLVLWTGIHELLGLHRGIREFSQASLMGRIVLASAVGSVWLLLLPASSHTFRPIGKPELIFFAGAAVSSLIVRLTIWQCLVTLNRATAVGARILIVGSGRIAERVQDSLLAGGAFVRILGFVDWPGPHEVRPDISAALLGTPDQLESILMSTAVDEVMIALPLRSCYDLMQEVLKTCERVGVPAAYAYQPFQHKLGYSRIEHSPLTYIRWRPSRDVESNPLKRAIDLCGAVACLILLSPVLLIIAIAIKLTSPGPVIFVQERYGLNKRKFRMYKFRTMVADAEARQHLLETLNEAQGPVFKMRNDPRITPLGAFLRKASLDELPQLFNVLKGDMSLVGPRPLPNRDVAKFNDACLMRRFSVKPGLTCLWQITGRSNTSFDEWITLDLKYIDDWSLSLDAAIMAKTIPAVLKGRGAM